MSEWYYHEKNDIIRDVESIKRTAENTDGEVRRLQRKIDEMTRSQEEILKAFQAMAEEVAQMREEMYPTVKRTKPALQGPKNSTKKG